MSKKLFTLSNETMRLLNLLYPPLVPVYTKNKRDQGSSFDFPDAIASIFRMPRVSSLHTVHHRHAGMYCHQSSSFPLLHTPFQLFSITKVVLGIVQLTKETKEHVTQIYSCLAV